MELTFTPFDYNENLAQQRELFKDCFPETNGEAIQGETHYNWKFHSFPNEVKSWEYASYMGPEIVGYYAAIPYRYKIGEKITSVGMVCDVMTSSKHRGKGIFTKLGTYATNELSNQVPFTMGYPIRKEVIPGHLKVGWEIPFNMPLYMKFIRLDALLKSKKLSFFAFPANILIWLYNYIVKTETNKHYSCELALNINKVKGYDNFAKEWSKTVSNALIKDIGFARWRYAAPERKYQFLSIYNQDKKMIAFVSYRKIEKEGVPSYGILDYMVLPGFKGIHGFINNILIDSAKKERVEAIITMMSKNSASNYKLCKNGFFRSPFVFQLIIKNLTKEFSIDELFSEKNWHLMWVDSDDL